MVWLWRACAPADLQRLETRRGEMTMTMPSGDVRIDLADGRPGRDQGVAYIESEGRPQCPTDLVNRSPPPFVWIAYPSFKELAGRSST